MSRRRKSWLGFVVLAFAALLVWVAVPVDLIPSWASWGSVGEMQSTVVSSNPDGTKTVTLLEYNFAEGFARDLTGLRLDDAAQRVRDLPGSYATYRVVSNNLLGQPQDAMAISTRIDFTVVLGRVVRTTLG